MGVYEGIKKNIVAVEPNFAVTIELNSTEHHKVIEVPDGVEETLVNFNRKIADIYSVIARELV